MKLGKDNHYTPFFDTIEEALLELRCLEKRLSYETVQTIEMEGYYPQRAILIEDLYQKSGKNDGLYSGLASVN